MNCIVTNYHNDNIEYGPLVDLLKTGRTLYTDFKSKL